MIVPRRVANSLLERMLSTFLFLLLALPREHGRAHAELGWVAECSVACHCWIRVLDPVSPDGAVLRRLAFDGERLVRVWVAIRDRSRRIPAGDVEGCESLDWNEGVLREVRRRGDNEEHRA